MLGERSARLVSKDAEGFLKPLSPQARAVEEPIARGALQVPLSDLDFSVGDATSSSRDSYRGLEVDLVYRYDRLPRDNTFRIPFIYDLDRLEGRWTVTASKPAGTAILPVWATGPIQFVTSAHFLVLFRPGLPDPNSAAARAEEARTRLAPKLTVEMDPVHLVLMARNRTEYESMGSRPSPISAVAQQETTFAISRERIAAEGRLIVANLERIATDKDAIETLQHELGHLALAPYTRPFTPGWVSESAAMYLAGTRPVPTWRQGVRMGRFEVISFTHLTPRLNLGEHDPLGATASYEYAYSAAAAWYLVETFGNDKYWSFYSSYSQLPAGEVFRRIPSPGVGPEADAAMSQLAIETTTAGLQRFFGLNQTELDSRVRTWIRNQVR